MADHRTVSGISRSHLPGPFIYAAVILVALVRPLASIVLYGLVAAFYVVEASFFGSGDERLRVTTLTTTT